MGPRSTSTRILDIELIRPSRLGRDSIGSRNRRITTTTRTTCRAWAIACSPAQRYIPTPTKSLWFANANSILGNVKWHYNTVVNVLPRIEMVCVNEWWWSTSCEWADVVFGVDSWAELKHPDMTASVTNPFLSVFPRTPLKRIFHTMGDIEVLALVASKMAALTGDARFNDYWKFVHEGRTEVYLQRILDHSCNTKGFVFRDLEAKAKEGIPAILQSRTSPKAVGYEQVTDSRPWYTKSGRLEFYREEDEFIEAGENCPCIGSRWTRPSMSPT